MTYVLDTNALSALMKGSAAVVERLAATAPRRELELVSSRESLPISS